MSGLFGLGGLLALLLALTLRFGSAYAHELSRVKVESRR
jgi:hypothetical protein